MNGRYATTTKMLVIGLVVAALSLSMLAELPEAEAGVEATLVTVAVTTGPMVDGDATDTVWADATAVTVEAEDGINFGTTGKSMVTIKSVYTTDTIYFLFQWDDPTYSVARFPWVYNDTTMEWSQLGDTTTHDENVWYEDKFAVIWNINDSIEDFNLEGCNVVCHDNAGGVNGLKFTNAEGEKGDTWHWKSVRTGFTGQVDDKYVQYSPTGDTNERKSDAKTAGGYTNNRGGPFNFTDDPTNNTTMAPLYFEPAGTTYKGTILESDFGTNAWKVDEYHSNGSLYNTTGDVWWEVGDTQYIGGVYSAPFQGPRGDVSTGSAYASGTWTLEVSRALETGDENDVQFADKMMPYHFGVAPFDNSQIRHAYQDGNVVRMVFDVSVIPDADDDGVGDPDDMCADTAAGAVVEITGDNAGCSVQQILDMQPDDDDDSDDSPGFATVLAIGAIVVAAVFIVRRKA